MTDLVVPTVHDGVGASDSGSKLSEFSTYSTRYCREAEVCLTATWRAGGFQVPVRGYRTGPTSPWADR